MNEMKENKYPSLLALVKARKSVRAFTPAQVERDKLEYMLEVARLAPSAVNFQPWCFVVVRDSEQLKALHQCYPREWFASAPACIVVCGNHEASWKRAADGKDFCDVDVAIATEHLALAAVEQGLGTCWVCNFDVPRCREVLNLPPSWEPVVLMPVGYPADLSETERKRKPLNDVVKWERF
ncbi:MAG TPA: nitroreductase family protein [Candidatus Barnesiella excrementavium]|nr:nitroreductase family protein [Candidatus Barnesiella excrementavium]